jgi:hypothetical protein
MEPAVPGTESRTAPETAPASASATERSRRAAGNVLTLVPEVLVILAEAAWISVVGGLIEEFSLHSPELGIPALALVVAAGAVAARTLGPRAGPRWPFVAFGLVVAAAMVGWLASGAARASLGEGIGPALGAHPGGLLAGVAMLRGFAHARLPPAESTLTHMLAVGAPGLAFAALVGGIIGEPFRSEFLGNTLAASILFVGCTVLALAFARLGAIGDDQGLDWRHNPIWLALTLGLLIGAIALSLPLASVAGTVIAALIGFSIGPLLVIGLMSGLDRAGRRVLLLLAILVGVVWVRSLFGNAIAPQKALPSVPGQGTPDDSASQIATIGLGGLLLLGLVALILILAALWMRRSRPVDDLVEETRTFDRGGAEALWFGRRRRRRRRVHPTNAAEAYVALLADLEGRPGVRRDEAETPREHAARLRASGTDLSLDLLAADYALVRDGGRMLSAREDRRAINRWRSLRRRLAKRQIEPEAGATAAEGAVPIVADRTEAGRTGGTGG